MHIKIGSFDIYLSETTKAKINQAITMLATVDGVVINLDSAVDQVTGQYHTSEEVYYIRLRQLKRKKKPVEISLFSLINDGLYDDQYFDVDHFNDLIEKTYVYNYECTMTGSIEIKAKNMEEAEDKFNNLVIGGLSKSYKENTLKVISKERFG